MTSGVAASYRTNVPAEDLVRKIDTARWHINRYDTLRASVASRASFVIGADAVVVTGLAFAAQQALGHDIWGGEIAIVALSVGAFLTVVLAALSVAFATRAFQSNKPWRVLYGKGVPPTMFYQSRDTIREAPTFAAFESAFGGESLTDELRSAVADLWANTRAHVDRYRALRRATTQLQLSLATFALSLTAAIALVSVNLFR